MDLLQLGRGDGKSFGRKRYTRGEFHRHCLFSVTAGLDLLTLTKKGENSNEKAVDGCSRFCCCWHSAGLAVAGPSRGTGGTLDAHCKERRFYRSTRPGGIVPVT